jgi:hypothetical protein
MKKVIAPLALAACALAAAVPAMADDAAPAGKSPVQIEVPPAGKLPNGFQVVVGHFQTASNTQTTGRVFCPTGKVPVGGGVFNNSFSLLSSVGGSYPDGNAWTVDLNNIGSASSIDIYAMCAKLPRKYQIVRSTGSANQGQQGGTFALCPAGTVVLGGGVDIASTSTAVSVNSTMPFTNGNGWLAEVNNGGGGPVSFQTMAICAKAPKKYVVITSASAPNAGQTQGFAQADCPSGTAVISGGVRSDSSDIFVNVNTTAPLNNGWQGWVNNATSTASTLKTAVICA